MKTSAESCDLCGLPLRFERISATFSGKTYSFCCLGCRQVFNILLDVTDSVDPAAFKETKLFKQCREKGIIPKSDSIPAAKDRVAETGVILPTGPYNSSQTEEQAGTSSQNVLNLSLKIGNLWCPACAWLIDEALKKTPGVIESSCNFSTDRLQIDYDPVRTSPQRIIRSIDKLGFRAAVPDQTKDEIQKRKEFTRFAISAFLTMNVMMISFALYSGFFSELSQAAIAKLSWPLFFMASFVLFYGGHNIFKKALAGCTSAAASMETLIAVGSLSAYIYSIFNLLTGNIHLYFDTASMLITLVLLGKILEGGAKNRVQQELENFFSLYPTKVKVATASYPDGRYVAVQQLRRGDIFLMQNGEVVPADGLVIDGSGSVDESSLTGEAVPITRKPGDRLKSGTKVIRGAFKAKAEGVGEDSILGQMIGIMEKALGQKTPLEGRTDRILQWFVPAILTLALGTGLVCRYLGLSLEQSIIRAVTVMVISCPCALGVAIPLARVAGISVAGRMGILVRDFSAFEQARRVDSFVFDKTGTITQGQWELNKIVPFNQFSESQVLALAASLETASDHYIAIQIKQRAVRNGMELLDTDNVSIHQNGIVGRVGKATVKIGSKEFLAREIAAFGSRFSLNLNQFDAAPSLVYMSCESRLAAAFIFGDTIREGASATLKRLQALGYSLAIVSGDGEKTTRIIGQKVNVQSAQGGMLPPDKAKFIDNLRIKGHRVAMVGDGINDAPALARADLAVAVHSGSHLGKEVADLTLMRGEPVQILDFLNLTKRVNQKVNQNLICSFIYNILSIPIAMSGLLNPLVAFIYNILSIPIAMSGLLNPLVAVSAMLLSSLSVTVNTLLLVKQLPLSSCRNTTHV
jgi:heavy metal translocating P-type ATPase